MACVRRQVEDEIAAATRASLLAVFASQAALLALSLKLHVVATLKAQDANIVGAGEPPASAATGTHSPPPHRATQHDATQQHAFA